jgi:hypothetical protein
MSSRLSSVRYQNVVQICIKLITNVERKLCHYLTEMGEVATTASQSVQLIILSILTFWYRSFTFNV